MNILLIDHYAGSFEMGMEYRPFYFAKEWEKSKHHTTIIAGTYSHIRTKNIEIKGTYTFSSVDNIEYLWLKTPEYNSNGMKRFISMLVFVWRIFCKTKIILNNKKYDVVIASSTYPLDIFPARHIAKKCKAKLVYEVHDLWPLSPMELGGYSQWHPFIMLMQYAENYAYKKADSIISLLPNTLEHMITHGLKRKKWNYIPNGIDPDQWDRFEKIPEAVFSNLSDIRKRYSHIVAYTGSLGLANALDSFIDAAKMINDIPVAFLLFGKGPLTQHFKDRILNEKINNAYIFDPVSKNAIPHLLSLFDFLYIGLQDQPLYRFGISPNKLIDYMMAGKPVILAINAGNNMVKEADCGLSVEPENPTAIASAIRTLLSKNAEDIESMGKNGRKYILQFHTYKYLANKFLEAVR